MIANIIDNRKFSHTWKRIWGVIEPTRADNSIFGADQAPNDANGPWVESKGPCTMQELIDWAAKREGHITLYIYEYDPDFPGGHYVSGRP